MLSPALIATVPAGLILDVAGGCPLAPALLSLSELAGYSGGGSSGNLIPKICVWPSRQNADVRLFEL